MAIAAARSIFRSPSVRNAASKIASEAKSARSSPFRTPSSSSRTPLSHRIFRCPAEMSACLESLQPYHTVTASALMTSMLTDSLRSYSWLSEAQNEDV
ncbi:protein NUCLEAR FUSION DEFECTIVE 6, mitochondrial-like isoform X1 [Lycium ferocissimum]|uniref:protein NUCLEAR FUSION DEFECTIVE 6, mitochondrial-like isoform X1 n=1 Tax=Lycium ferocissimum TaxID=112874 RepID=UPI0028165341|nr:protein NUCLEAR FUSION DEFECTIVE 6, mitochondrial-like isoform X1 [Lycium ferocissimum]